MIPENSPDEFTKRGVGTGGQVVQVIRGLDRGEEGKKVFLRRSSSTSSVEVIGGCWGVLTESRGHVISRKVGGGARDGWGTNFL